MPTDSEIKVGPDGQGSYRYAVGGFLSAARYHNAASAWHDARRPQTITEDNELTPDKVSEGLLGARVYRNWPGFLS